MSRERLRAAIIRLPPRRAATRRLKLFGDFYPVLCHVVISIDEITEVAVETVAAEPLLEPAKRSSSPPVCVQQLRQLRHDQLLRSAHVE